VKAIKTYGTLVNVELNDIVLCWVSVPGAELDPPAFKYPSSSIISTYQLLVFKPKQGGNRDKTARKGRIK